MEQFEITTDKNDTSIKGVACIKRQLYMRRLTSQGTFPSDMMVVVANLGNVFNDSTNVYFEILYPNLDRQHTKWDMELFFNAAEFFCQVELDSEPVGFELVNQQNFYPYNNASDLV